MHSRRLMGAALAGVLLLGAVPADAKPCSELVLDKAYRCTMVAKDDASTSEVCARFLPGGTTGIVLLVDGLRGMPCACEHSGSIDRPRFGASAEFACIGDGRMITGKATKSKLDKVFSRASRSEDAFAAVCVLDTTCSLSD